MTINRDWNRKEEDDFQLRVVPHLNKVTWAHPLMHNGIVIAWSVKGAHE